MNEPLSIAFVWHMHQPYYRSSSTGPFEMPWVRLHALKDYADMVAILDDFPAIHQTFNLVPSLLEQLEHYAAGDFQDRYWEHTLVPAEELDDAQRDFIVDLMVERSSHPRTQRSRRYLELSRKKEACIGEGLSACAARFTPQELRDLQVWFTLAWFDPRYLEQEPLTALVAMDRDFSEEDKAVLAAEQARILADTLPTYQRAVERGQVELTTTPYYHPILPLLIDSDLARVARGDIALPSRRYAHAEDAREQLERGLDEFGRLFGGPPRGLWCSEMAVGEVVIPLLAEAGLEWTLSDEGTLGRSLGRDIARNEAGHVIDPAVLYSAYRLEREGNELSIVFRDRILSDLIGFTYQTWAPHDAAANLVWRLREIRRNLDGSPDPHLVTIALDGENAWEYYQRDGRDFLTALYDTLGNDPGFACVTVSEFLDRHPATRPLPWLHTGSWIYADLSTWMGDPAHTRAWDLLHDARDHVAAARSAAAADLPGDAALIAHEAAAPAAHLETPPPGSGAGAAVRAVAPDNGGRPDDLEEAWRHILIAEGSDWFWWFSPHQESGMDHLWDLGFRRHLQEAYRLTGAAPPGALHTPILTQGRPAETVAPTGLFTPVIDGILGDGEWETAGVRRALAGGAMQTGAGRYVDEVRYGTDEHHLFVLVVPGTRVLEPGLELAVYLSAPEGCDNGFRQKTTTAAIRFLGQSQAEVEPGVGLAHEALVRLAGPGEAEATLAHAAEGEWDGRERLQDVALGEVLELAIPLTSLGLAGGYRFELLIAVARDGVLLELFPPRGTIGFDLGAL